MSTPDRTLTLELDGSIKERRDFLRHIRTAVMELTGEVMTLDALINEIAKNIFDHAGGVGSIVIVKQGDQFEFVIKDGGQEAHDYNWCKSHSRLAGNGQNFGIGLRSILDYAEGLKIDLQIDTTKGFSYRGIYQLGDAFQ